MEFAAVEDMAKEELQPLAIIKRQASVAVFVCLVELPRRGHGCISVMKMKIPDRSNI